VFYVGAGMTLLSPKDCMTTRSIHSLARCYGRISAQEEVNLTQKFIWRKRALILKNQLGDIPNSQWAGALGMNDEQLCKALAEAELAEKRLLAMGLRLSLTLAKTQFRKFFCEDLSDFVHDGLIIFFDAVESFDSRRAIRLSTYAYSRIRSRFTEFNRDSEKSFKVTSFSTLLDFDCSTLEFEGNLEDKATNVLKALNELPERQRLILLKRFGIRCQVQSAQDIARAFGVSYETIRKDQIAAISALKKNSDLKALVA
jgi:RNA polymerase sigma factor (sigma-70 family)